MATWGSYLTSYVKKKGEAAEVEEISENPSTAKPIKPFVDTGTSLRVSKLPGRSLRDYGKANFLFRTKSDCKGLMLIQRNFMAVQ